MTDDETLFRAPRLTRLEVQGFKSFLNRTTFAFEPGITAIVGPNGSGKSNVADAVRWVLGEQGQSALRARKTEDVIFSGGQGRAAAGMAEATLTFDNADGWLPTEYAEVSVTRRAFRSGENQYLINGRRVRLKDVALLTAGLGQSHVVVGQGLIDAALSLRAEDRRGLFEHAADLTGLRLKVAEAERNLAETEANTTRLRDLLVELEPRLKSLERAARQAKEWQSLRDRLRDLQGAHYRDALERATGALESARQVAAAREAAASAAGTAETRLVAEQARVGDALAAARDRLARHDEHRSALEERPRRLTHERDLAAARLEALSRRRADMDDARQGLDERVASVAAELKRLAADLRELERATADCRESAARHGRELAARRQSCAALDQRLAAAQRELAACERNEAELLRRRAVLDERATAIAAERERLQTTIAEGGERIASLLRDAADAEAAAAADDERSAALDQKLVELESAHQATASRVATERAELDRLQRSLGEAAMRLEVLRRLQESGAGLFGGVKEVLAAARRGHLSGILGTVAELVIVPLALEVAIEVALGSRLRDVVVERWADAEAAIAHLKSTGAGRATFQPLDTVRAGRDAALAEDVRRLDGYRGVAAELVDAPANVAVVVAALLGRTLVVEDLATARAALAHLAPGWSVVTIGGEIARAGGSVSGGAAARESGTLGRERELRELPTAIAALEQELTIIRSRLAEAEEGARRARDAQRQAESDQAALRAAKEGRQQQRSRLERWLGELQGEQERSERRWRDLEGEQERMAREAASLDRDERALAAARETAARSRTDAEAALAGLLAAAADLERAAADEGRRLAGLEERLRGERRREAGLRSQERALAEELTLRAERSRLLDREREILTADLERLSAELDVVTSALARATAEREPLRDEAAEIERTAATLTDALQRARLGLLERERERDHAALALERAAQDWETLRQRIVEDLDVAVAEEVLAWESPEAAVPAAARENEIGKFRERLRRVGYVGDDAVAEYERESAHQRYLEEQLADIEGAAAALRDLLADLRQTMRARFDETFARVAEAFAQAFATLFGGGTARLVLTAGDDGREPGIEIVAQPPGKRLQNLALLSGGERALTAAALLFAILKVNPVPFCLLDEVDAALDEANVVRFRERLRELARQTQIIVITHNRGTIEIADTLYGVSMGADGVSQVLSLRMTESLSAD
jgi:chromosome segregation protein